MGMAIGIYIGGFRDCKVAIGIYISGFDEHGPPVWPCRRGGAAFLRTQLLRG